MKLRVLILSLVVLSGAVACTKETHELKSPCVGLDESPCGPKRPANV